jgi:hypothetical protein
MRTAQPQQILLQGARFLEMLLLSAGVMLRWVGFTCCADNALLMSEPDRQKVDPFSGPSALRRWPHAFGPQQRECGKKRVHSRNCKQGCGKLKPDAQAKVQPRPSLARQASVSRPPQEPGMDRQKAL